MRFHPCQSGVLYSQPSSQSLFEYAPFAQSIALPFNNCSALPLRRLCSKKWLPIFCAMLDPQWFSMNVIAKSSAANSPAQLVPRSQVSNKTFKKSMAGKFSRSSPMVSQCATHLSALIKPVVTAKALAAPKATNGTEVAASFLRKICSAFLRGFINLLAAGKHDKIGSVFHITMGQNAV